MVDSIRSEKDLQGTKINRLNITDELRIAEEVKRKSLDHSSINVQSVQMSPRA